MFDRLLILIAFIPFGICTSCQTTVESTIEGLWTIDTIEFRGYDIKPCLIGNVVSFKTDKLVNFPTAECNELQFNGKDELGTWEVIKSTHEGDTIPFSLKFTCGNEVFHGFHKIVFHKDEKNKLLKMEIFSKELYIICKKVFHQYDSNIELMDLLEQETWTTRME